MTIGSSNNNNSTVHVSSTSNHVLDVIGVTGTVDVGIVPVFGRELDVGGRDGDTTLTLLRSLVNSTIFEERSKTLGGLVLGDGSGQCGLRKSVLEEDFGEDTMGGKALPFRDQRGQWYLSSVN